MANMEVAMGLIAGAGDARSSCMEAIQLAKEGNFQEAKEALHRADDSMVAAHETQTQLIREESEGVSLLMVHAQDHLNLALVMRDVAEEFILVHQRLMELEGKK